MSLFLGKTLSLRVSVGVLALAGFGTLTGCGKTIRQDDISVIKHDIDKPVRHTGRWQWQTVSDEEYKDIMAPLLGLPVADFLPADDKLVTQVQHWIDLFDTAMRERLPEQLANVPKPTARVIKSDNVNAFIAPVPVCYDVSVKLEGDDEGEKAPEVYLELGDGTVNSYNMSCKTVEMSQGELKAWVDSFNKEQSKCKLTLDTSGERPLVTIGKTCERAPRAQGIGSADRLMVMRTASWVTIFTQIMKEMGEKEFAAVVAHELGHYYRSHVTVSDGDYWYYYKLPRNNPAFQPKEDKSLREFGEQVRAAAGVAESLTYYVRKVEGQKIPSDLFMALGTLSKGLCSGNKPCPDACKDLNKLGDATAFKSAMDKFPLRSVTTPEGKKQYAEFEKRAFACFSKVTVDNDAAADGKTLRVTEIRKAVQRPSWPWWTGFFSNYLDAPLKQIDLFFEGQDDKLAKSGENFIQVASDIVAKGREKAFAPLKKAYEMPLGQYTTEQEADEFSVEWLTRAKVDPKAATNAYLSIAEYVDREAGDTGFPYELNFADCSALAKNGWKNAAGEYQFVSVGDFAEVHHGLCYRSFNTDRDILAHDLKVSDTDDHPAPPFTGDMVRALASSYSLEVAALRESGNRKDGVVHEAMQRHLDRCAYSKFRDIRGF